jgi:hypothetical protein
MGKIEEVPDEEIERLAKESGLWEKLPPDFVPFEPGTKQRQEANRNAWAVNSDSDDDEDEDDDYGRDEYSVDEQGSSNARAVWEASHKDAMSPQLEKTFDLIIWTMPFGFLYLLLDIMIQQQYAQHPSFIGEMTRVFGATPCECPIILS